jgi:hypothetical protein
MTTALPGSYNVLHYTSSLLIRSYDKQYYLQFISFNKKVLALYWHHDFMSSVSFFVSQNNYLTDHEKYVCITSI